MANPVVYWEIGAKDDEKLRNFYAEAFHWDVSPLPDVPYATVETGGGGINGGILRTPGGKHSYVMLYVQVDDPQAYLDRIERLGGQVVMPPTPIPNVGTYAFFADPEGNVIGLYQS
jgi:uncharacterized protein